VWIEQNSDKKPSYPTEIVHLRKVLQENLPEYWLSVLTGEVNNQEDRRKAFYTNKYEHKNSLYETINY